MLKRILLSTALSLGAGAEIGQSVFKSDDTLEKLGFNDGLERSCQVGGSIPLESFRYYPDKYLE